MFCKISYYYHEIFRIINSWEVYESNKLETVLDLGSHILCDNLKSFPIKVLFCTKCFTAHQISQTD